MKRRDILILTGSHLCRCPRAIKEAAALAEAGHDVTVVSVSRSARFADLDRAIAGKLPIRWAPVELSRHNLASRCRSWSTRLKTRVACVAVERFGLQTRIALGPVGALATVLARFPSDLVILHQEAPLALALTLAQRGRRFAADIEDWYSEDLLDADRRGRPIRLLRTAERIALQRAAYCTAPSGSMANALAARYDAPVPAIVRNTFPLPPDFRTLHPAAESPPAFVWFSQTIGPGRGLELFLRGWSRTTVASRLEVMGDVRAGFAEELLSLVPARLRESVRFLPFVPPAEVPDRLVNCDMGLALELDHPPSRNLTITNKILQYLGSGLAVVATPTSGQREVLSRAPEAGIFVDLAEPSALARQLDAMTSDPERLRRRQAAARAAAESEFDWNRHDAPRLVAAVAAAVN